MTNRRIALAALLLSLATLFCTLRPSGAPGGPSGPISDDERIETLDKISEAVETSTLPDGEVDRAALLKYFESNPQFELSGEADDGSVWARFSDGRLVIVPPPIPEAPEGEAILAPSPDPSPPAVVASSHVVAMTAPPDETQEGKAVSMMRQQAAQQYNLPANDIAIVMSALGTGFADASADVNSWLNQKGYSSRIVDPTVENLKAVRNVGVFYITTHGGKGCLGTFEACESRYTPAAPAPPAPAPPQSAFPYVPATSPPIAEGALLLNPTMTQAAGPPQAGGPTQTAAPRKFALTYALWTSTPVDKANDAKYKADLDGQFLAYMLAKPASGNASVWRYAITGKFVSTYMRFSDDSLAFIDACSSMGSTLPDDLREANVSSTVGWTTPSSSLDRPNYFFDRLLGINAAYSGFKKPDPPNRPFDVASVMAMMKAAGTTTISSGGKSTELVEYHLGGSFSVLRPTIALLVVHEDDNELEIQGVFGSEEGQVTIDGVDVAVQEWDSLEIRVTLPGADESGGSGDVIVKVRDHESNAVPLTLWHVKFTYTEGPEQTINAYQRLYLDVYWRADVHRYRDYPDDSKFHERQPFTIEPADASSGSWDCDWSGSYLGISFTTETGQGDLPFTREGADIGFTSAAEIDPEKHTISHLEFEVDFDEENTCVVKSEGFGYSATQASGFVDLPSLLDEVNPDVPVTEPLELDEHWTLTWANRSLNHDGKWPWLKWEDTTPEHPPDDKETEA